MPLLAFPADIGLKQPSKNQILLQRRFSISHIPLILSMIVNSPDTKLSHLDGASLKTTTQLRQLCITSHREASHKAKITKQ